MNKQIKCWGCDIMLRGNTSLMCDTCIEKRERERGENCIHCEFERIEFCHPACPGCHVGEIENK